MPGAQSARDPGADRQRHLALTEVVVKHEAASAVVPPELALRLGLPPLDDTIGMAKWWSKVGYRLLAAKGAVITSTGQIIREWRGKMPKYPVPVDSDGRPLQRGPGRPPLKTVGVLVQQLFLEGHLADMLADASALDLDGDSPADGAPDSLASMPCRAAVDAGSATVVRRAVNAHVDEALSAPAPVDASFVIRTAQQLKAALEPRQIRKLRRKMRYYARRPRSGPSTPPSVYLADATASQVSAAMPSLSTADAAVPSELQPPVAQQIEHPLPDTAGISAMPMGIYTED